MTTTIRRASRDVKIDKTCPDCESGTIWRSKYGGNDPDVWAVRCERCDGTGEIDVFCDGWKCREPAVARHGGDPCCAVHLAEWLADEAEDPGMKNRQERIDDAIAACRECGSREFPKQSDCDGCIAAVDEEIASEIACLDSEADRIASITREIARGY